MKVLVTGANGFLGRELVQQLSSRPGIKINAMVRDRANIEQLPKTASINIVIGDLVSSRNLQDAIAGVDVVYHLASGTSGSHTDLILNSVVGTENLLDQLSTGSAKRFVLVSSFSVYGLAKVPKGSVIDEYTPIEEKPYLRDSYTTSKVIQERLTINKCTELQLPLVIIRPGKIYGPGSEPIPPQLGLRIPGICFLYIGGNVIIPFTHVVNCAEAILLAGIQEGVEGEAFNIVDDDLPSQKQFLNSYKKEVGCIPRRIWIPFWMFKIMARCFEVANKLTKGNIPPVITRYKIDNFYKYFKLSNSHAKTKLNWVPRIPIADGIQDMLTSEKQKRMHHINTMGLELT